VLEGGAIDVDGTGLLVTTEQCLLNPNRNPGWPRGDRGAAARGPRHRAHAVARRGLLNDHTDGHVDNLARFVGEGRLALPVPPARTIPTRPSMPTRAPGRGVRARGGPLPSPGRVERDGEIIPASYMNFYIGNAAVVVPLYGAPTTMRRWRRSARCSPAAGGGARADHVLTGGGSFHCISQQVPADCISQQVPRFARAKERK
jgi:agmatine deiminase